MNFMYSGSIEIPEQEVQPVLAAAKVLRLDGFYRDEINIADVKNQTNKLEESEDPDQQEMQQTTSTEIFVINDEMEAWIKEDRSKEKSSEKKKSNNIAEKEDIFTSFDRKEGEKKKLNFTAEKEDISISIDMSETSGGRSKAGRFPCSQCGASYASQGALVNHRRGRHEGRVYTCTQTGCSFSSAQAGNLKTHLIKRH